MDGRQQQQQQKKQQPFTISLIYGSCFLSCMLGFEIENRLSLFPVVVFVPVVVGCSELRHEAEGSSKTNPI